MASFSAGSAKVDISPNMDGFATELRAELERIQQDYEINITADLTAFRAQLQALRTEIGSIIIDVDLNDALARARLDDLTRNRRMRVDVDVDSRGLSQVSAGASNAHRSLSLMAGVRFGALAAGIAALIPVLGGVAGAAGAAAGALSAIGGAGIIGSVGIVDAFKASGEAASGAAAAADDLADRQQAVADAAREVSDAQRGVADAQQSARDAQQELNDSYQEAARYLRDMNDELVDAKLNQEDAEISLAEAQQNRTKVNSDPRSDALDRARAQLQVDRAEQRLKEARSKTADQTDDTADANRKGINGSDIVKQAQDRKKQADQGLIDAQNRLADATRNLAKAQQELASPANAAGGGVDKFAEAMAKLAPNAQEFVRQMQALGPAWTQFRMAVQDRLFEGLGASVTQFAQQNLPGLRSVLVSVAGYLNTTFKSVLTDLTSMFQRLSADGTMYAFVTSIGSLLRGVSPLITGFAEATIQMTAIAGPALGGLLQSIGGLLTQIAPALGTLGAYLAGSLTQLAPALGSFIAALANGLGPVLPVIASLLSALGNALTPLIPPLSQILQTLGTALVGALNGLAPAIGPLGTAFSALISAVAPILPVLGQLIGQLVAALAPALTTVFNAFAPVIQQVATMLLPVIQQLAPVIQQVGQILAQYMVQTIQQMAPLMVPMVQQFLALAQALIPMIPSWTRLAVELLPLTLLTMRLLLPILTRMLELFTWLAQNVLPATLGPLNLLTQGLHYLNAGLDFLGQKWSEIWGGMGSFLSSTVATIRSTMDSAVEWFRGLPARIRAVTNGLWDGIKESFKSAINWVITAWNNLELKLPEITIPNPLPGDNDFKVGGQTLSTPNIPLLASGGAVRGPGGPKDDLIPALLSNGEFVVNAATVDRYGVGFFTAMNAQRFAEGGLVGAANRAVAAGEREGIDVAVKITDPDTNESYFAGKQGQFPSASVIKLLVASAAALGIDEGRLSSGSVLPVLNPMISQSSNEATNELVDMIGGFGRVNAAGTKFGLSADDAHLGRKLGVAVSGEDPNRMTIAGADKLLTLFSLSARGKIPAGQPGLSQGSAQMIVDAMKNQQVDTKYGAVLPNNQIADKTGELGGASHDVGYFFDGNRWLQVSIFTNKAGAGTQDANNRIIQAFGRDAFAARGEKIGQNTAQPNGQPQGQPAPAQGNNTALDRANAFVNQQLGKGYQSPPSPPANWDCSMLQSGIYASLTGQNPNQRFFTTEGGSKGDFEAYGFVKGLVAGAYQIGVMRGGGGPNSHMAGTMPNGDHIESGGKNGVVTRGPSAAGADDPQFSLRWSLLPAKWNPPGIAGGDPNQAYPGLGQPGQQVPDGRDDPQKYQPGNNNDLATTTTEQKNYPTSISGWAGFLAENFVGGQVKSALGIFGINDSPGFLQAGVEAAKIGDNINNALTATGETGKPDPLKPSTPQNPNQPAAPGQPGTPAPGGTPTPTPGPTPAPGRQMPTNTPEGGIAAGSPGAKAAFWAEWAKYPGWQDNPQWFDTLRLFNKESGWNANAQNPNSTAYGVGQFLDGSWASVGESKSPDPAVQARATGKYLKQRPDYGSPSKAWEMWQSRSPHWYHDGGYVRGVGDIPAFLEGGEYVVNALSARNNMPILEAINASRPMPTAARPSGSGRAVGNVTNNWTVQSANDDQIAAGMREQDRRVAAGMVGI